IAEIAARQHDLVTAEQLRGVVGLSARGIAKRVERGALCRRHRGVYSLGHADLAREGLWMAGVLGAGGGSGLSHHSAAELHGITRFRSPLIAVFSPRERALDGVKVHRYRRLDPRDATDHRGIPATTVHRTLVDLTDVLTATQLANVIHEAAFHGRFVELATR